MPRSTRILLILTSVLATLVLLSVAGMRYVGNVFAVDSSIHGDFNSTARDAMEEGTFVRHVEVAPETMRTPYRRLLFGGAWIHEDSHLGFRWLVQRRLVREGTYTLCFNLAEGAPASGMSLDDPLQQNLARWFVDAQSGRQFFASNILGEPWRWCRPVEKPFPARISVALVERDSLIAGMQRFAGAVEPPAPAQTRHEAEAVVRGAGRTLRLTHTDWNGLPMLWISEREAGGGASARWRVLRVLDYPAEPLNYGIHYGTCGRPGEPGAGTLLLRRLHDPVDVNAAWRVDPATADLVHIPVQGLACRELRRF